MYFLGIDSGTQSTKAIVLDLDTGKILASGSKGYDLIKGLPAGHLEQRLGESVRVGLTSRGGMELHGPDPVALAHHAGDRLDRQGRGAVFGEQRVGAVGEIAAGVDERTIEIEDDEDVALHGHLARDPARGRNESDRDGVSWRR